MMSDFESVFDKHKEDLTRSLVFFGEGVRVNKLLTDEERKRSDYYYFYEAGQQSQQQKIDDLNNQLLMLQKQLNDTEKWIEENKKWIALGHWEGWTDEQYVDADELLEVLKGEPK